MTEGPIAADTAYPLYGASYLMLAAAAVLAGTVGRTFVLLARTQRAGRQRTSA